MTQITCCHTAERSGFSMMHNRKPLELIPQIEEAGASSSRKTIKPHYNELQHLPPFRLQVSFTRVTSTLRARSPYHSSLHLRSPTSIGLRRNNRNTRHCSRHSSLLPLRTIDC